MDADQVDRRLAAIVALDVVGFSAMMHRDEVGTLSVVKQLQSIVDAAVTSRRGRVFKLTGDGALAEFRSVVDAFAAACELLGEARTRVPSVQLRVGIHMGDLMFVDGDVFGDGVNVAARLEGQARPNTIAVSERAWHDLRQSKADFEDLGPLQLKNIGAPIRVLLHDPSALPGAHPAHLHLPQKDSANAGRFSGKRIVTVLALAWAAAMILRSTQGEGLASAFTEAGISWPAVGAELIVSALLPLHALRFAASPAFDLVSVLLLVSSLAVLVCYVLLARRLLRSLRARVGFGRKWAQ